MKIPAANLFPSWDKWVERFRQANSSVIADREVWTGLEFVGSATFTNLQVQAEFVKSTRTFRFIVTWDTSTPGTLRFIGWPKLESSLDFVIGCGAWNATAIQVIAGRDNPVLFVGASWDWGSSGVARGSIQL